MRISDFLEPGLENRITGRELQAATGLSETVLRKRIHDERMSGALILSSSENGRNGYFLPANLNELKAFDRFLEGTAASYEELRPTFRKAIAELEARESHVD